MLDLIKKLIWLNYALLSKAKAVTTYDQALALYTAKDYKAAAPLMIQAAEMGSPDAMSVLGSMYLLGQGVNENGKAAVDWLQQAVDLGYEGAVSILGMAYATGKAGVRSDIPKAREMLTSAAARGDQQSARMLQMIDNGEGMFVKLKTRRTSNR